jgi:hypothetical protein
MRQISVFIISLVTSFAVALSGLMFSQANAVDSVVQVTCGTGNYTVTTVGLDVTVSDGSTCSGAVVIQAGVTSIGGNGFKDATSLASIAIPASVTSIGGMAFFNATSLNSVTFSGDSLLTSIGYYAFSNTTSLALITIPATVKSIGMSAFQNATALETITFAGESTLTSIGMWAFAYATKLTAITIPAGVTRLETATFKGAIALTSITMPASITFIDNAVFDDTTALTSITVEEGNSSFLSIDGVFFYSFEPLTLITYPSAKAESSYQIPANVTGIGDYAFLGTTALTSITIPAGVTDIGYNAFENATLLNSVEFLGNAPTVYDDAFLNIGNSPKAYIKFGATGFILDGTGKWNGLTVEIGDPPVDTPESSSTTSKIISIKLPKFYTSVSTLTKSQKSALKNLVGKSGKKATFTITGTAGKLPGVSDQKVKALAKKRAQIVKAYLIKLGVSKSKIKIKVKITNEGIIPKTKILARYLLS